VLGSEALCVVGLHAKPGKDIIDLFEDIKALAKHAPKGAIWIVVGDGTSTCMV
jgi:hypothetical protein